MPRLACCVTTCKGTPKDPSTTLIPFPKDPVLTEQWRLVSGLPPDFTIKSYTRICSKHFRSGKRSLSPDSEDYIPSVFEDPPQVAKRSYCKTCRKVTLNCPCKLEEQEASDDESGDENNGDVEDENQEDVEESEDNDEEQEEEEAPEEELDDGQLMDSDDDDWTPAAETAKPRRSSRPQRKRRHASSSESSDDEESEGPPPPKAVKKATPAKTKAASPRKGSPAKKVTTPPTNETKPAEGHAGENGDDNGTTTPADVVTATPKQRRRRTKKDNGVTPAGGATSEGGGGDAGAPAPDADSTPKGRNKKITAVPIPTTPSPQDAKVLAQMKEMEIEHSMKMEKILKINNLRFANLKEEHLQAVHRMKVEWELEKANLTSQIEYYKELLHQRTLEEQPVNPFNGGQPIIVLQLPDHDEVPENNGVVDMEEEQE